jgi:hypothetical protein
VTGRFDAAASDRLRRELLTYCALDTRAMVEIWRTLQSLVASDVCRAG